MTYNNQACLESAEMCFLPHLIKQMTVAALTARMSLKPKKLKRKAKAGVLATCSRVVNHLLGTNTTENVISGAIINIPCFIQQSNTTK